MSRYIFGADGSRHQRFPEEPGTEVRNDHRQPPDAGRPPPRRPADHPDADRNGSAGPSFFRTPIDNTPQWTNTARRCRAATAKMASVRSIVDADVVHRREEARGAQAAFGEGALDACRRVGRARVDHERADDPGRVSLSPLRPRTLVARDARNQHRARDAGVDRARQSSDAASSSLVPGASHPSRPGRTSAAFSVTPASRPSVDQKP